MSFVQHIAIPSFVEIERGCLTELPAILSRHHLRFNTFTIVSGSGPTKSFADQVAESLQREHLVRRAIVAGNAASDVDELVAWLSRHPVDVVVAVGGGRVLDVAKAACGIRRAPLILMPTSVSSDSIASPVAVIRHGNHPRSQPGQPPIGVVVDMAVMAQTPERLLKAGIGDLLSNLSAAFDWRLARDHRGEAHNAATETMARLPAERMLDRGASGASLRLDECLLRDLAEGLVLAGLAMSISGSSRPCSGSEHMISHALDQVCPGAALHGEQVFVASLFTLHLQGQHETAARARRLACNFAMPHCANELGLGQEDFLRAVEAAPATRPGRFSILDLQNDRQAWRAAYVRAYAAAPGEEGFEAAGPETVIMPIGAAARARNLPHISERH